MAAGSTEPYVAPNHDGVPHDVGAELVQGSSPFLLRCCGRFSALKAASKAVRGCGCWAPGALALFSGVMIYVAWQTGDLAVYPWGTPSLHAHNHRHAGGLRGAVATGAAAHPARRLDSAVKSAHCGRVFHISDGARSPAGHRGEQWSCGGC